MRMLAMLVTILDLIADAIDLALLTVSVTLCMPFKVSADFIEALLSLGEDDPGGDGFEPHDDGKGT